jgi:hypothetical protein
MPAGVQLMPVRFEERRNRGLIGGGIALLGIGYLPALITGAMIGTFETGRSRSDPDGDIAAASWVLLLPVAGPFISGLVYRGAFWALPWILVDGAAQVSGLALLVVGAMRREKVPVFIAPMAVAGGTGLALAGDF